MAEQVISRHAGLRQKRKPRANMFTPAKRQKFLDALALTCNVSMAASHAGVSCTAPYRHRARDPQFIVQWREALETGYDRLEALVLEHGGAGQPLEPGDPMRAEAEMAPPPFDFDRALAVLRQYRATRQGRPKAHGGPPRRNATREETNAALLKALAAAHKRLARIEGEAARGDGD
ncbi:hypothetical protein [Sphingomonas sp. M1-B02]|uniref:hypothetical protein n=1 Tax=Sphingomonas sp. M1-B02 TaxID=3114300 RepID=UPI00223EE256|nr:hypothetical protein [Sphingomonas sp. S6-11]UZK64946.1 hypothetical protein OKW87_10485 [Sphingomonas sp. S6-11]